MAWIRHFSPCSLVNNDLGGIKALDVPVVDSVNPPGAGQSRS